ncbi:hypothetical protein DVH24_037520 [Malus domestica]|uniref:H(+)-transporting two-sector ATPase n=1 Tax=Malus domestica TaxID=3750 RepID=A0A498KPJ0_MALDO|nr:hypothetical protein DVH24_037520 [Malus domestica]
MPSAVVINPPLVLKWYFTRKNYFYQRGSITSIQAVYVPADDLTILLRHDLCTFRCYYRTIKRLAAKVSIQQFNINYAPTSYRREEHYETAQRLKKLTTLQRTSRHYSYPWLDELSEDDRLTVARARKIERSYHNPFRSRSIYRFPRKICCLAETIRDAFLSSLYCSNIDEATAKATTLELRNGE